MEINVSDKFCIITPLSQTLDKRETFRIQEELKNLGENNIALDLKEVEDCTFDFIELIKEHNLSLFNIPSDIFLIFNIMGLDRQANLFVSELDFKSNKHRLIQRNFKVV